MTAPSNSQSSPRARFRELLRRPTLTIMPGGFSPLYARMAEQAGFDMGQPGARFEVHISESNRGGLGSTRYNAQVKIIHDLLPKSGPF